MAPLNPPDPIFNLNTQYKADKFSEKVNVGIGAYRTEEGKPWILPTVKKVEKMIVNDPDMDHEYLPIDGLPSFTEASARLVLGCDSPAISENRVNTALLLVPLIRIFSLFSIVPFRQYRALDLCDSEPHSFLVLHQKALFTFQIQHGDHIKQFSGIAIWKFVSILTTSVRVIKSILMDYSNV